MNRLKFIIQNYINFYIKKICTDYCFHSNKINGNATFFKKKNDKKEEEKRIPIVKFRMFI